MVPLQCRPIQLSATGRACHCQRGHGPPETRTTSISRPMRRALPFLLLGTFIVSAEVYPFFGMQCAGGTRLTTAI